MAASSDGVLLAWGTELGNIFIVNTDTGDQLAMWRAHWHAVESLTFSPDNTALTSCGVDIRPSIPKEEYMLLTPEEQEAMPRRCSVVKWDLERWIMQRMKTRLEH
jgi:WD40 repeat protein